MRGVIPIALAPVAAICAIAWAAEALDTWPFQFDRTPKPWTANTPDMRTSRVVLA
jgi:hypothetical protein